MAAIDDPGSQRFYHGTRTDLKPGEMVEPGPLTDVAAPDRLGTCVYLTSNLDEAIWGAELAAGEGPGRVYRVEPTGTVEDAPHRMGQTSPGNPTMSNRSREPLRVIGEVTEWRLYHGTRADLKPGDLIEPGHAANFGKRDRTTTYVYLTRTLEAAT